jgi:hypothetical protein
MINRKQSGKTSDQYAWNLERPEQTQELLELYDIRCAKQCITQNPRPVELISLATYGKFFDDILEDVKLRQDIDWATVDIDLPLIFGREHGKKFPLDERHRLAKALRLGVEWVPAVFLTEKETAGVRII